MTRFAAAVITTLFLSLPVLAAQAGRIEGRVWNGATPAAGVTVLVEGYGPGNSYRGEAKTDNAGRFVARDVPPGKYRVSRLIMFDQKTDQGVSPSGTGTHGVRAEVGPGGTTSVTIGGSGRSLIGRLVPGPGLAGRRLAYTAGNFRFLTPKEPREPGFGGRVHVLLIDEDGNFRCGDLPPGEYDLFLTVKDATGPLDAPDIGRVSRILVIPPDASGTDKPHDVGRLELEPAGQ